MASKRFYDKYYREILEMYDFLDDKDKKWFDKAKLYSQEKWARYVARNIIVEDNWNVWCEFMDFKYNVYLKTLGEYNLALNYFGGWKNKIYVKHNSKNCNHYKFWAYPQTLMNRAVSCPMCGESKGEIKIRMFLRSNKIKFIPEYSFDDLRGKRNKPMPFDFAIFDKDNLIMLIEFDGSYHYVSRGRHTADLLEKQQYRDKIKDKYCKDNNIKLLRIPYWEYKDIEKILTENLLCPRNMVKAG